jgi:glycosyltransferase involved in cell wall biosynthesis
VEIIVVDDASTDQSVAVIKKVLSNIPAHDAGSIQTIFLPENLGNCKAFNRGLAVAQGKYVIDFATDDVMMPKRIEKQVNYFELLDAHYGVVFTEAAYIDKGGQHLSYHFQDKLSRLYPDKIPTGEVYADVLSTYFISSPTMMMRKQVLNELSGYDEQLAYEDFDFWVRSARHYKYAFLDECLTKVRKSGHSLSTGLYRPGDPQLHSTYLVCQKAVRLNKTPEEQRALVKRIKFEIRQAVFSDNTKEADLFFDLFRSESKISGIYKFYYWLSKLPLKLSGWRNLYLRLRY